MCPQGRLTGSLCSAFAEKCPRECTRNVLTSSALWSAGTGLPPQHLAWGATRVMWGLAVPPLTVHPALKPAGPAAEAWRCPLLAVGLGRSDATSLGFGGPIEKANLVTQLTWSGRPRDSWSGRHHTRQAPCEALARAGSSPARTQHSPCALPPPILTHST